MGDACARRHSLQFPRTNLRACAETVLVFECARKDPGQNFHVLVRVFAETGPRCDAILIDDAQGSEAHVFRVVVLSEGECVAALQPAELRLSAVLSPSDDMHAMASLS